MKKSCFTFALKYEETFSPIQYFACVPFVIGGLITESFDGLRKVP